MENLAQLITLENGKTLEEARGDIRRGFEVVEFACGIAHLSKGESLGQVAPHIDGLTLREPLGVCAGITPFNFPAMVPMWMFPLAIACGNTFILKPSEKVPLTLVRLAELLGEAGLPEGVFNVVQGGREKIPEQGFFVGPTLFDHVTADLPIFREEIFGPVLALLRPRNLGEALALLRQIPYGNGATIFTSSGGAAREFVRQVPCGMVGVNVGVPAPMSLFPFSGWNQSFFGDLHMQGIEGIMFYTRQKVVLSRWDNTYRRTQGW